MTEMVNRLEPKAFRWIESSLAEQKFLGWTLHQLQEKSFLEIVHPDDLDAAPRSSCKTPWPRGRSTA